MAKDRKPSVKAGPKQANPGDDDIGSELIAESKGNSATITLEGNEVQLSVGEVNILGVFRKYLMTPGRMLCLNNTDIGTMKRSLDKLIAAGLLKPEDFKGSYSLTRSGFIAMNELS